MSLMVRNRTRRRDRSRLAARRQRRSSNQRTQQTWYLRRGTLRVLTQWKTPASQQARNGSVRFRPRACQTRRRLQPVCIRARHTAGHTSAHAAYKGSYLFSCENQKDAGRKAAIKASSQFQSQSLTAAPDCVNLKISQNSHWLRWRNLTWWHANLKMSSWWFFSFTLALSSIETGLLCFITSKLWETWAPFTFFATTNEIPRKEEMNF